MRFIPHHAIAPRLAFAHRLLRVAILLGALGGLVMSSVTHAQLAGGVRADKYLIQVEQHIKEKDYEAARKAMAKILALSNRPNIRLPNAFHYKHAQVLNLAGYPEETVQALHRYIKKAGRTGTHYKEALALLNQVDAKRLYSATTDDRSTASIVSLIVAGADINTKGGRLFSSPLQEAVYRNRNPSIIHALIDAGADVKAKDRHGNTPLHYAAWGNNNPEVTRALLAEKVDVNAKDRDGHTPLHYALWNNGDTEVIRTLIVGGADVNARDHSNDTPKEHLGRNDNLSRKQKRQVKRWLRRPHLIR